MAPPRITRHAVCRLRALGVGSPIARRLAQMGILPGVEVTVVRVSPLGGPVEVAAEGGQSLALRAEELRSLECDVIAAPLPSLLGSGGTRFRVRALLGKSGYTRKMLQLGLVPGAHFRLQSLRPLELRLTPDGAVVVLGRGEAEKLLVEPLTDDADVEPGLELPPAPPPGP
jgi:Fe2+ transport system protein FeoA